MCEVVAVSLDWCYMSPDAGRRFSKTKNLSAWLRRSRSRFFSSRVPARHLQASFALRTTQSTHAGDSHRT